MRKAKFNEILEECIAAVLEGRRSVDDCLSLYPQLAPELEPLLATALEVNDTFQTESPSWHVQERVRLRVLAAHQARIRSRNLVSGVDLTRSSPWRVRHWGVLASAAAAAVGAVFVASLMLFGSGGDGSGPGGQGAIVTDIRANTERVNEAWTENGEIDIASLLVLDRHARDFLAEHRDVNSIADLDPAEVDDWKKVVADVSKLLDTLPEDEPLSEETGGTVRDLKDDYNDIADIFSGVAPPTATPPVATDSPTPTDGASPTPVPSDGPSPTPTPAPTPTKAPSPTAAPTPTPAPTGDGGEDPADAGGFGAPVPPPQ